MESILLGLVEKYPEIGMGAIFLVFYIWERKRNLDLQKDIKDLQKEIKEMTIRNDTNMQKNNEKTLEVVENNTRSMSELKGSVDLLTNTLTNVNYVIRNKKNDNRVS